MPNKSSHKSTRRSFLETTGMGVMAGLIGSQQDAVMAEEQPASNQIAKDIVVNLKPNGSDLGNLYDDVMRLASRHEFEYSFLGNHFKSLDEFKKQSREKVLDALLFRPPKVDLKPKVIERVDMGDIIREKVLFSTSPDLRVPAYIQIPKGLKKPAPAIIDLHSHGGWIPFGKEKVTDLGKHNHPAMTAYHKNVYDGRATGTALARRGYVVISIDAFFFGERRTIVDADLKMHGFDRSNYNTKVTEKMRLRCREKEATLVKALFYAGLTWQGILVNDDMRTVDYLLTRPEVDPLRIGCNGISLGGYRSLFLAGLDERIAAANVVGFMSTARSMIKSYTEKHSWSHFPPAVHRYLDMPDVVSMMAPKPLLVQQCTHDGLFPLNGMKEAVNKIDAIYKKAGVQKQFTGKFYNNKHLFTRQMQDDAFSFFDTHLKSV